MTPLLTTALPLLRYRIGDAAARLPSGRCRCGRGLGRIGRVQGRAADVIRTPDGRHALNGVLASSIMARHPVRRYQVRQAAADRLRVDVVPGRGWTAQSAETLARDFGERLDGAFTVLIVEREDIPPAPSGKFQTIVPLERL